MVLVMSVTCSHVSLYVAFLCVVYVGYVVMHLLMSCYCSVVFVFLYMVSCYFSVLFVFLYMSSYFCIVMFLVVMLFLGFFLLLPYRLPAELLI